MNDELIADEAPSAVVMFVDIVDSRLSTARVELLKRHNALVADQVEALAAELSLVSGDDFAVVKFVSDAVMITFNTDRAKVAVECAKRIMLALQRDDLLSDAAADARRPKSGIGMSCGKIFPILHSSSSGDLEDKLGSPIDAAAYLVSVAQAGQVLIDWSALAGLLKEAGGTSELAGEDRVRRLQAKGMPAPIEVDQLFWHKCVERLDVEDTVSQRLFLQHLLKSAEAVIAIVSSQADQFEQPPTTVRELSQIGKSCRREFRNNRTEHAIPTGRTNSVEAMDGLFAQYLQPEAGAFRVRWDPLAQQLSDLLARLDEVGDELVESNSKDAYKKLAPFQDILSTVEEELRDLITEAQRSLWELMDRSS